MNIGSVQTSSDTSGSTQAPAAANPNQLDGNSFIALLTAQLQSQDPLNPVDPTQFTTQLVQFNQLQQLINIDQLLQQAAAPPATAPAAGGQNPQTPITGGN